MEKKIAEIGSIILKENWPNVLEELARLNSLLNNFSDSQEKKYYLSLYWSYKSEYFFHFKRNFVESIDCLRKAIMLNPNLADVKILLCRFLLYIFSRDISKINYLHIKSVYTELNEYNIDLTNTLGEYYQSLNEEKLHYFTDTLNSIPSDKKMAFLSILGSLIESERGEICDEFYLFKGSIKEFKIHGQNKHFYQWILITCRHLLDSVDIDGIFDIFKEKKISEYRLWLYIDAIYIRAIINEYLNDLSIAKVDINHVLNGILFTQDQQVLNLIPHLCKSQLVLFSAKLPLIELGTRSRKALVIQSFEKFFDLKTSINVKVPIPLHIGMVVYYVSTLLDNISSETDDASQKANILKALDVLFETKKYLDKKEYRDEAHFSSRILMEQIKPLRQSQYYFVRSSSNDPYEFGLHFSAGSIGILIAAIYTFHLHHPYLFEIDNYMEDRSKPIPEQILALLEWSLAVEINPHINTLWNLGCMYTELGLINQAVPILKQCYDSIRFDLERKLALIESNTEAESDLGSFGRIQGTLDCLHSLSSEFHKPQIRTLESLGFFPQASTAPWIVAEELVRLMLNQTATKFSLQEVLAFIEQVLQDFFGPLGQELLNILYVLNEDLKSSRMAMSSQPEDSNKEKENPVSESNYVIFNIFEFFPCGEDFEGANNVGKSVLCREDYALNKDFLTIGCKLSELLAKEEGLVRIFSLLGKVHARFSRASHFIYTKRLFHRKISLRIFDYLYENIIQVGVLDIANGSLQDLGLEYSVLLAESGQIELSKKIAKESLQSISQTHLAPSQGRRDRGDRLCHFLSLLLCMQSDQPDTFASATILCKESIQGASMPWNHMYTLALIYLNAGEKNLSLNFADGILQEVKLLLEYNHIRSIGGALPEALRHTVQSCFHKDRKDKFLNPKNNPLRNKKTMTKLLVGLYRIFQVNELPLKSFECLETAWRILFIIDPDTSMGLKSIMKGETDFFQEINIYKQVPTLLGWRWHDATGWDSPHEFECEADILAAAAQLIMAEGPQSYSRVKELYQIALTTYPYHVQALIGQAHLEYTLYKQHVDSSGNGSEGSEPNEAIKNKQILFHSEMINVPASVKLLPSESYSDFLESALHRVKNALIYQENNCDAWYLYSCILSEMGLPDQDGPLESLRRSVEAEQGISIRPFDAVLL